jgi:hypothetical protein
MNQDVVLMDVLGSAFQIVTYGAVALFVVVLLIILWLCWAERKSVDK